MEGSRSAQTPSQQAPLLHISSSSADQTTELHVVFLRSSFVQLSSLWQTAGCRGTAVVPRESDHHEGPRKLNAVQTETSSWLEIKSRWGNKVTRLMAIHLLAHPPLTHNHFIKVFSFITAVRSMRRKWAIHQHREEEAAAGEGCGTGPGEKEVWLQGSTEGRKAERLKINYTHSATGGAKQHLPERQATPQHHTDENWKQKLPLSRMITSFPLGKHRESLATAEGRLWTWASYPLPPNMGKRLPCSFSCVFLPCSFMLYLSFLFWMAIPRSMCCFLPPLWLGKGTLEHWPWSLQMQHSSCTRALSDWALQWISTQESCTYLLPLWTLLHTPCRDAPKYRHGWCLRTHNISRSLCPSWAQLGFLWDLFPTHRIRF